MNRLKISVLPINTNNNNTKKDYATPIKEIFAASSINYVLSPIRSKRILIKLIWLILLIGFLIASIYYVVLNIKDYLKYETNTSIYEVNEPEVEFPTISFCDSRDKKNFNITFLILKFQNEDLNEEWQNHFELFTDSYYGKCYRFNSGFNWSNQSIPIKKSIRSGVDDGFWLNFYFNTTFDYSLTIFYIHNNTEKPDTINRKGFYVSPGSYNFFTVKRIMDQKLELPYNDCFRNVSESESKNYNQTIINLMNEKNTEYSQKECLYKCVNLKYYELNPFNQSLKPDVFSIVNKSVQTFIKNSNINELCLSRYCPLQCNSLSYDININFATINGKGNVNQGKTSNNFAGFNTYENISKTFFGMRVYYNDLKYTLIDQHPKIAIFDLISSVGGTLGLFLGFSFISLLDLFEILAELVFIRYGF